MKGRAGSWRIEITDQVNGQATTFQVKEQGGQPVEYLPGTLEVQLNGVDQGETGTNFLEGQDLKSFEFTAFMIRPPSRLVAFFVPKYGWHRFA